MARATAFRIADFYSNFTAFCQDSQKISLSILILFDYGMAGGHSSWTVRIISGFQRKKLLSDRSRIKWYVWN